MRWRVATALALILCAGAALVAQQDSDRPASARLLGVGSIPFFERPQLGTSTYWEEPESAESRAWAHLLRKLTRDDSAHGAPRGRTGGAGGGSQWHFLRLPGQPFDVGFRPRNVSEDSADNSTESADNSTDANVTTASEDVSGANATAANSSGSNVAATDAIHGHRGLDLAALIRDGERRERVENIDTEGRVVSGASRAWAKLLGHLRGTLNLTTHPWTQLDAPFKLGAGQNDSIMRAAAQPFPSDGAAPDPACQCQPGQRITGPTCGGGGDSPWRVYGFYFLYDTQGCMPCQTCLAGYFMSTQCDGTTVADTVVCTECRTCKPGTYASGEPCGGQGTEDTQECVACPEGSYCSGGDAQPVACRSTCEPGYELEGACLARSPRDATSCRPCEAGSFCFDGAKSPCTSCAAGEYMSGEWCAGGSAADSQTCTPCAPCEAGQYMSGQLCSGESAYDTQSCQDCKTNCSVGEYLMGGCDGSGRNDSTRCLACQTCGAGYYQAGEQCDGTQAEDTQVCEECAACERGQYMTGRLCDGTTAVDTQTCAACQTCSEGFYIGGAPCWGNTSLDTQAGSCVPCHEGPCPLGFYSQPAVCGGSGFEDVGRCHPCAICTRGQYQAGAACDGTGSSDTVECKECSKCNKGEYIAGAACDGLGVEDTQTCLPCTECPAGTYSGGTTCQGDSTADTQTCWVEGAVGVSCNYACSDLWLDCSHDLAPLGRHEASLLFSQLGVSCDQVARVEDEQPGDADLAPFLQVPVWDSPSTGSRFSGAGLCLYGEADLPADQGAHRCNLKHKDAVRLCQCVQAPPDEYRR